MSWVVNWSSRMGGDRSGGDLRIAKTVIECRVQMNSECHNGEKMLIEKSDLWWSCNGSCSQHFYDPDGGGGKVSRVPGWPYGVRGDVSTPWGTQDRPKCCQGSLEKTRRQTNKLKQTVQIHVLMSFQGCDCLLFWFRQRCLYAYCKPENNAQLVMSLSRSMSRIVTCQYCNIVSGSGAVWVALLRRHWTLIG